MTTDDLVPLLTQQQRSPTAQFSQGKLLSWDAETFRGVVQWRGTLLRDLTVLNPIQGLTLAPGDEVVLAALDTGGRRGGTEWAIFSKPVAPGDDAAAEAIAFMTSALATRVARGVFAAQIRQATADGQVDTGSSTPVELSGGPEIADVEISDLGLAIVMVSGLIFGTGDTSETGVTGSMNVEVSGATTKAADDRNRLAMTGTVLPANQNTVTLQQGATKVIVFDDLNPGLNTFTTVYSSGVGFPDAFFTNRSLIVIAV